MFSRIASGVKWLFAPPGMILKSRFSWSRVMFCAEISACLDKEYFVIVAPPPPPHPSFRFDVMKMTTVLCQCHALSWWRMRRLVTAVMWIQYWGSLRAVWLRYRLWLLPKRTYSCTPTRLGATYAALGVVVGCVTVCHNLFFVFSFDVSSSTYILRACDMYGGRREIHTEFWRGNLKERDNSEDLGIRVEGKIT